MAADYPDWVMAHKKKDTYINKVGGYGRFLLNCNVASLFLIQSL